MTIIAVIGITPYIALQLQSVTLSLSAFAEDGGAGWSDREYATSGLWVAAGLALFTILFGTRNLDANDSRKLESDQRMKLRERLRDPRHFWETEKVNNPLLKPLLGDG